jgi:hypothetical protein
MSRRPSWRNLQKIRDLTKIDCFPQKDNLKERVFEDAKLSTCVILWRNEPPIDKFVVHTHPGKHFEETSRSSSVAYEDVRLFDADELNIPNLNQEELNIVLRLTSSQQTDPFGKYADVIQGEINLTGDAKHISTKPGKHKIIRGAQVVRYRISDKLSQGEPLFLNKDQFLATEKSTSKAFAFQDSRIVFQRNTGVDDARRIHAALLKRDLFAADSLNFLSISSPEVSSGFLLGILNSTISEWRFRLSSTNNHVNAYEIKRLPTPRIRATTSQTERGSIVEKAVKSYESREYAAVLRWVEQELSWSYKAGHSGAERNDTVHDLLAHLAVEMASLHEKRGEIEHAWREWVESILPPNHKPIKTFLEQGWIAVGLERGWEGVKAEFQARKAIPSGRALQDLRRETEEGLEELRPLYERIRRTDELIDQIVYRLYGLTEEEISVVEASVERG